MTITMPRTAGELADFFNDKRRCAEVLASPEALSQFVNDYASQQCADGSEMHRSITAQAEAAMIKWLKDNGQTVDASNLRRPNLAPTGDPAYDARLRAGGYNAKAVGAQFDNQFEDMIDFMSVIWERDQRPEMVARRTKYVNEMSTKVGADGGFLVPETFRAQLLSLAMQESIVRSRATIVPMATPRVSFPMLSTTSTVSSLFGGMIAYWTAENAALTESAPKFKSFALEAHKLTGFSVLPNELLTHSPISVQALLDVLWPQAMAHFGDVAFTSGTGVGEPLGFRQNPATITVSKEAGQEAGTILWENIINMYSRMLPTSQGRAIWLASPDTFPQLATMALQVGTGGSAVWLTSGTSGPPLTILGRPVIMSEKMGTLGTQGDLAYVDLSYYLVGDLQAMRMESSAHYRFGNDQTAVRIIEHLDGRPWLDSPVTPTNGGATMSPFVELEARA